MLNPVGTFGHGSRFYPYQQFRWLMVNVSGQVAKMGRNHPKHRLEPSPKDRWSDSSRKQCFSAVLSDRMPGEMLQTAMPIEGSFNVYIAVANFSAITLRFGMRHPSLQHLLDSDVGKKDAIGNSFDQILLGGEIQSLPK